MRRIYVLAAVAVAAWLLLSRRAGRPQAIGQPVTPTDPTTGLPIEPDVAPPPQSYIDPQTGERVYFGPV